MWNWIETNWPIIISNSIPKINKDNSNLHLKLHRQFQTMLFQSIPHKFNSIAMVAMVDVNGYGKYPKSSHPLHICFRRARIMYISFIIHTYVIRLKWSCLMGIIAIQMIAHSEYSEYSRYIHHIEIQIKCLSRIHIHNRCILL